MSCKIETKNIKGRDYTVTQWPAEKALLLKFKLMKYLGASISTLISLDQDGQGLDSEVLASTFHELFKSCSPQELVDFLKEIVMGCSRDGVRLDSSSFTTHFSGESLFDIYPVALFILSVNYSSLISGLRESGLVQKFQKTPNLTAEDTQTS